MSTAALVVIDWAGYLVSVRVYRGRPGMVEPEITSAACRCGGKVTGAEMEQILRGAEALDAVLDRACEDATEEA